MALWFYNRFNQTSVYPVINTFIDTFTLTLLLLAVLRPVVRLRG